jgi:hypothetical protein
MRTVLTGIVAFILYFSYWGLGFDRGGSRAARLGASEEPPYTEEGNLFWLVVIGWVAATLVGVGLTVSMRRSLIATRRLAKLPVPDRADVREPARAPVAGAFR